MDELDGFPLPKGFGVADVKEIAELTGLEYMNGIAKGEFPAPTMTRALQFRLSEVGEGTVVFTGIPGEDHLNPMGIVHGGYAATLLDSAMACAVQTLCGAGFASTSIDLKVNFVRPITTKTGRLFARGTVVHPGRQIATAEGRLEDENGKLFAHGAQACSIFKL